MDEYFEHVSQIRLASVANIGALDCHCHLLFITIVVHAIIILLIVFVAHLSLVMTSTGVSCHIGRHPVWIMIG